MAKSRLAIYCLRFLCLLGLMALVRPVQASQPEAVAEAGAIGSGTVQVFISGAVKRPGVYRLPVGARLVQAIHLSGGLLPGTPVDQLALTRPLIDGEQVHVAPKPVPPPAEAAPPVAQPAAGRTSSASRSRAGHQPAAGQRLSLNKASVAQLDGLPGIGPKRARDIVQYRQQHGPFRRVEDLQRIPGVGPKLFQRLRPHLSL